MKRMIAIRIASPPIAAPVPIPAAVPVPSDDDLATWPRFAFVADVTAEVGLVLDVEEVMAEVELDAGLEGVRVEVKLAADVENVTAEVQSILVVEDVDVVDGMTLKASRLWLRSTWGDGA
jgi:hypothetical protein